MRKLNLLVTNFHHKSRKYNSYHGYVGRITKHLIRRRFDTVIAHQKITMDTTEFKYYEKGKVKKLTLILLLTCLIVKSFPTVLPSNRVFILYINALNQAIDITSDCLFRRTFHSDQDWAYQINAPIYR